MRDKTMWEVFEDERPSLVPYVGPFDGLHAVTASVSKTCLVRFDKNRYSVDARAVGRPVEIRAYADRLECWQDGRIVGQHERAFGREKTIFGPLHYTPVLTRKPGALRNGAPFKEWALPVPIRRVWRVWRELERQPGGDRQMVDILTPSKKIRVRAETAHLHIPKSGMRSKTFLSKIENKWSGCRTVSTRSIGRVGRIP
jgi:hypothetical protein